MLPFVNVDAGTRFALQHCGKTAVIFVRMGEDDAADVRERETQTAEPRSQS